MVVATCGTAILNILRQAKSGKKAKLLRTHLILYITSCFHYYHTMETFNYIGNGSFLFHFLVRVLGKQVCSHWCHARVILDLATFSGTKLV